MVLLHDVPMDRRRVLMHYEDRIGRRYVRGTFAHKYYEMVCAYPDGMEPLQISRELRSIRIKLSPSLIGKWRRGQSKPRSVKGIESISGLFPLNVSRLTGNLRPLSRLAFFAHLSGYNNGVTKTVQFTVKNHEEEEFVRSHIQDLHAILGLEEGKQRTLFSRTIKGQREPGGAVTTNITLEGTAGHAISRVFHEMGVRYGKSGDPVNVPDHVKAVLESLRGQRFGRPRIRRVLRDYMDVLMLTRTKTARTQDRRAAWLPWQPTRVHAEKLLGQWLEIAAHLGYYDPKNDRSRVSRIGNEGKWTARVLLKLSPRRPFGRKPVHSDAEVREALERAGGNYTRADQGLGYRKGATWARIAGKQKREGQRRQLKR